MFNVAIFFIGFVLAVIIGQKMKINAGLIAVAFGFILTWIYGGEAATSNAFIKSFPASLFWNYSMPVIFYAFASANGTLTALGRKISYKFRNARWALPIAMYIVAGVVAAAGAGTMNTAIVGPLAWGLCLTAGVTPMIVPFALWTGSFLGSFVPWTSNGALLTGLYMENLPGVDPTAMAVRVAVYYALLSLVVMIVMFIITKAWVLDENGAEDFMTKPEPFSKEQKFTLTVIFICIALLLVPSILQQFVPNPVFAFMKNNFGMPVTSVVGISLVAIWGGADLKSVFSKHVNWNMILLITGMGMYCSLARTMGVVDTLGQELQAMPSNFIAPAICLIGAALSFVTSASTVQPMLFAMVPALATAAGCSMEAIVVPMMIGVGITSMSPVSTGGALCLVGAPEEAANKLFPRMLLTAVVAAIVCVLLCFTPIFRIGA